MPKQTVSLSKTTRQSDRGPQRLPGTFKTVKSTSGGKKVFIRSGIRFDYLLADKDQSFLKELCEYHVSGQLKVAPEHISDAVLKYMGKPENSVYRRFVQSYQKMNEKIGRKQFLVPYLMSSHPGSTLKEAVELAEFLRDFGYMPEQVQDFYPTPSTLSTLHVLYRSRPADHGTGLYGSEPTRKSHAAGIDPVSESKELRTGIGGTP